MAVRLLARLMFCLCCYWSQSSGNSPSGRLAHFEEIAAPLQRQVTVRAQGEPLAVVLERLFRHAQIDGVIDEQGIAEEEVNDLLTRPVEIELTDVPLERALDRLLAPVGLAWYPWQGGVMVTTQTRASEDLQPVVYDARDLVVRRIPTEEGWEIVWYDSELIDLIKTCVAPETWDDAGGAGSALVFDGMLVVNQTWDVHRQLASLLKRLRRALADPPVASFVIRWSVTRADEKTPGRSEAAPVPVAQAHLLHQPVGGYAPAEQSGAVRVDCREIPTPGEKGTRMAISFAVSVDPSLFEGRTGGAGDTLVVGKAVVDIPERGSVVAGVFDIPGVDGAQLLVEVLRL